MFFAAVCAAALHPAWAQVDLSGGATVGIEYNTNPVEFSNAEADGFAPGGKKYLDDQSLDITVGGAAKIGGNGPFKLNTQATYHHTESRRFDKLGHDEYSVSGSLDWKPGNVFDMTLDGEQYRDPIQQADASPERATLKTTSDAHVTLRLRATPRWELALKPGWIHIKLPLDVAPDYQYRETNALVSLTYLNPGRLAPGVEYMQSRSRNSNIGVATRYRQQVVRGTLNYQATGFSTFTLAAGHSKRTTNLVTPSTDPLVRVAEGTDSAFTGALGYQRRLTAKTSINITAIRDLQQYEAGTNTSVGTGFSTTLNWAPTTRIAVDLFSQAFWAKIEDLRVAGTTVQRTDLVRTYQLGVTYNFSRVLSMRGYASRRLRNSSLAVAQFNSTVAGLDLAFKID